MRRLCAAILALTLFFMLSPCAFAATGLQRPGEGQLILMDCDNSLDYRADFPLAALRNAFRTEDDLVLEFPAARMHLKGFFSPLGDWRRLYFSDGGSIGGGDFDADGSFKGSLSDVSSLEKAGEQNRQQALSAPVGSLTAEYSQSGFSLYKDGHGTFGELRQACLEAANALCPDGQPDWKVFYKLLLEFRETEDGGVELLRAEAQLHNGLLLRCTNPGKVFIADSSRLFPVSEGRSLLRFYNERGEELMGLEARCVRAEDGGLAVQCICPGCKEDQGEALHALLCGHFSCDEEYEGLAHESADCGIAGHCAAEGEHQRCGNCLEPVCDGQQHGFGLCLHQHNWVLISFYASRCASCGYEYSRAPAG